MNSGISQGSVTGKILLLPATLGDSAFLFVDNVKIVFSDPDEAAISPLLPPPGTGRWNRIFCARREILEQIAGALSHVTLNATL